MNYKCIFFSRVKCNMTFVHNFWHAYDVCFDFGLNHTCPNKGTSHFFVERIIPPLVCRSKTSSVSWILRTMLGLQKIIDVDWFYSRIHFLSHLFVTNWNVLPSTQLILLSLCFHYCFWWNWCLLLECWLLSVLMCFQSATNLILQTLPYLWTILP